MTDDEALRRGRDGDFYPPSADERGTPLHRCRNGWLAPGQDGTPRPCLVCKPHLIRRHLPHRADPAVAERGRRLVRQALAGAGITTRAH